MMGTVIFAGQTAYCPHCRTVTNLKSVDIPIIVTERSGEEKIVISRSYHCETCGLFVRSDEGNMASLGDNV